MKIVLAGVAIAFIALPAGVFIYHQMQANSECQTQVADASIAARREGRTPDSDALMQSCLAAATFGRIVEGLARN